MDIESYIANHLIIKIGCDSPGYLFTDIIVDDPSELVEVIAGSRYYISGILWWERTLKYEKPKIGAGGIADPRSPHEFCFFETFLSEDFHEASSKQEYYDYFRRIHSIYPTIQLYPSFDIAYR